MSFSLSSPSPASAPLPQPSPSERFIVMGGTSIEPWVACDEIFKMDRTATIAWIARGEFHDVSKVLAFDLQNGTCRDATTEIVADVMTCWADADEFLDEWQYEFVELHAGILAARAFVTGRAA